MLYVVPLDLRVIAGGPHFLRVRQLVTLGARPLCTVTHFPAQPVLKLLSRGSLDQQVVQRDVVGADMTRTRGTPGDIELV